jgi:hypothetical protein
MSRWSRQRERATPRRWASWSACIADKCWAHGRRVLREEPLAEEAFQEASLTVVLNLDLLRQHVASTAEINADTMAGCARCTAPR